MSLELENSAALYNIAPLTIDTLALFVAVTGTDDLYDLWEFRDTALVDLPQGHICLYDGQALLLQGFQSCGQPVHAVCYLHVYQVQLSDLFSSSHQNEKKFTFNGTCTITIIMVTSASIAS